MYIIVELNEIYVDNIIMQKISSIVQRNFACLPFNFEGAGDEF